MWRAYSLFGRDFSDEYENLKDNSPYPVSAKINTPISPELLMKVHRDHYEGTKYDLTVGIASGPFGSPLRYDKGQEKTLG